MRIPRVLIYLHNVPIMLDYMLLYLLHVDSSIYFKKKKLRIYNSDFAFIFTHTLQVYFHVNNKMSF